jgi:hypothetical protein
MAYLTENQLGNMMDIPIALSSTDLRMGDWVVVAATKIVSPMRLTYKLCNLVVSASTVDPEDITNGNKLYGNLGLVYLTLRKDYISGSPGEAGGLDALVATDLGIFSRNTALEVVITTPGVYSWIIANNCQASTDATPVIPASTSIDFRVSVTGTARLELASS